MLKKLKGKLVSFANRANAARAAVIGAAMVPLMASATPTAKEQVITAINAGGADAKDVAIAVVIVLWVITSVYLMRRKG